MDRKEKGQRHWKVGGIYRWYLQQQQPNRRKPCTFPKICCPKYTFPHTISRHASWPPWPTSAYLRGMIPMLAAGSLEKERWVSLYFVWIKMGFWKHRQSGGWQQVCSWPSVVGPQSESRCSFSPCQKVLATQLATCLCLTDVPLAGPCPNSCAELQGSGLCPGQQLHLPGWSWQDSFCSFTPISPHSGQSMRNFY